MNPYAAIKNEDYEEYKKKKHENVCDIILMLKSDIQHCKYIWICISVCLHIWQSENIWKNIRGEKMNQNIHRGCVKVEDYIL